MDQKKYSPPALTIDFDTEDNRRTMASQLAYPLPTTGTHHLTCQLT